MSGKHKQLMGRQWSDPEPASLWVSLELDDETGEPCVVFISDGAFLTARQAMEAAAFIEDCVAEALRLNPPVVRPTEGEQQ